MALNKNMKTEISLKKVNIEALNQSFIKQVKTQK